MGACDQSLQRLDRAQMAVELIQQLQAVSDAAFPNLPLDDLLRELLRCVRAALAADVAVVLRADDARTGLVIGAALGLDEDLFRDVSIPAGQGIAGRVMSERRALAGDAADDAAGLAALLPEPQGWELLGVPLLAAGKVAGVVQIGARAPRRFIDADALLLMIAAGHMAQAMETARLHAAMQRELARRARVEKLLRDMGARLQTMIQAAPVAIVAVSSSGLVQIWNPAAERLFGWREGEVLGLPPPIVASSQEAEFIDTLLRVCGGETIAGARRRRWRRDGSPVDVLISAAPFYDAAGEISGAIALLIDATDLEDVRASHARMQGLSHQLLNAQESERRRLAHDLHDDVGQALTAIKIGLEVARDDPGAATRTSTLDEIIGMVDDALQQVRNLALDLRPSLLDDLGLAAALRWHVERLAQWAGFATSFSAEDNRADDGARLPAAIEIACFRAAQEALTNIVRHARARDVSVALRVEDDELTLVIRDDGMGFDTAAAQERAAAGGSLGLLGMREHIALAGGRIAILSAPGRGATVQIHFPLPAVLNSGGGRLHDRYPDSAGR